MIIVDKSVQKCNNYNKGLTPFCRLMNKFDEARWVVGMPNILNIVLVIVFFMSLTLLIRKILLMEISEKTDRE